MKPPRDSYTPPADTEAEAGMLACVVTAPSRADAVMLLDKIRFNNRLWYDARHSMICSVLENLDVMAKPLDEIQLYQSVKDNKLSDGLKQYVLGLACSTVSFHNWPTYYETIVDRAWRRKVLEQLRALTQNVCDTSKPVKDITQKIKEMQL